MSDLLTHLNPEQRQAVTLPAQSALILAGAGSGKTRVLTTRIAWLVQTGQASPANILAVTFTNKAAREMLTRLSAILPINLRGIWMGTFHGLCNRMLRAHYQHAGLPQTFQILDIQDQQAAIKRLLRSLQIDDQKYPPRQVQSFINSAKEQGLRPADVEARDPHQRTQVELYIAYQAQCQREGVVDFAELLLRCYELLKQYPAILQHYQMRFRHILIDEFQDTNRLQYAWLKLLAAHGQPHTASVLAVGDDDQSIYAFRGAEVENMQLFSQQFQPTTIKLEQNYRSYGNILDCANHLITHNHNRLGKQLRTQAPHGDPIYAYEAMSDGQEAAWLTDEIRTLSAQDYPLNHIAILYRSNAQSRVLEHALFSAGIPYRVYGGLRFFERAEIKHALAYLRLLANPEDDTAFLRVVNFPTRGIGAKSIETLQALAKQHDCALINAISYLPTGKSAATLAQFVSLLANMRQHLATLDLPELIQVVLQQSGLQTYYQNEREGQDRLENLAELSNAARTFISEEAYRPTLSANLDEPALANQTALSPSELLLNTLIAFLNHASLEAGDHQLEPDQQAVQMMTVHAAKGLEFHAVFITGLEEGLFPHENSLFDPKGVEEERRLMYVAITRARTRLYLSFSQTRMLHGQMHYHLRSRFLEELPEHCIHWVTPTLATPTSKRSTTTAKSSNSYPYRIGQTIFHNKFGEGTIIALEGNSDDARVQIRFKRHGLKWLALAVAKLEPVN
jgi:DNA helicase-2/ATP-dependent DNA helicase PcrA